MSEDQGCCRRVKALVCDFLAQELTSQDNVLVRDHLSECQLCRWHYETYRFTACLGRMLPSDPMPAGLVAKLTNLLGLQPPPPGQGTHQAPPMA